MKTLLLLIAGLLASAFGMTEALVMYAFKGARYHKAYLFQDAFGFSDKRMLEAFERVRTKGRTYHDLKNIWPTWLELQQERPSKALALLILLLLAATIAF